MLATTGNTSAVAGYTRVQIHENSRARFQGSYIIARDQKSNLHGTSFQSSHTMKVYNTRPVSLLLIKILLLLLLFFSTTEVLTCSSLINAFKRYNSWRDPLRKSSRPTLSLQSIRGSGHATILIPSFHGLR